MIISANKKSATYIQTNNNPNPPTTIPTSAASKAWQKRSEYVISLDWKIVTVDACDIICDIIPVLVESQ